MNLKQAVVTLAISLTACASPINQKTAENYYVAGLAAVHTQDWANARMNFGRAITNLELAGAGDDTMALVWYEYGRASGVICDWDEAKKGLTRAFEFDEKYGGPAYMSMVELAQMYYVQDEFEQSLEYFERARSIIERDQADTQDPIGYADFLDKYAYSLRQTNQQAQAEEISARSQKIRAAFENKDSHTDTTPYGSQCKPS